MDENVKNDAKQVMLVQNADDGRLQAVTGVDRDGNIQTADPTDQNVASLLNVNTQDSALEAFFKKFMEQALLRSLKAESLGRIKYCVQI